LQVWDTWLRTWETWLRTVQLTPLPRRERGRGEGQDLKENIEMNDEEVRDLIRTRPFAPVEFTLSDGRSVLVRHPEQVAVSRRKMFVMLARVRGQHNPIATPSSGDTIAKDWMMIDLLHVVSAEPANGTHRPRTRRSRKK